MNKMIERQSNDSNNNNEINEFIHITETTTTSITLPSTALTHQIASLTEFDSFESTMESFEHYSYHSSLSPSLSSVHSPLSPSPSSISLFFGGESSSSASSVFSSEEDNISHNQSFPTEPQYIQPNLSLDQEEVNNQVFAELFKDLETSANMILPTPILPANEQLYHEETTIFTQPPVLPVKPRASGRRRSTITKEEPDNSSSDSHSVAPSHRGRKRRLTVSRREADDLATTSDSHHTSGCEENTPSCMNNENDGTPLDEDEKKERNRKSAFLYRKKRKVYVQTLENQLSTLNAELHAREERMKAVEMENAVLKQQLTFFQSYLKPQMNDKSEKSNEKAVVSAKRSRKAQSTEVVTTNKPASSTTSTAVSTAKRGRKSIFKSPMSTSLVMLAILSCFLFCTPWFSSDFPESSAPQYNSNYEHHDYTFSPDFASSFPSSEPSSSYSVGGSSGRKGRVLLQIPGDGCDFDDYGMIIAASEESLPENDHIQFAYPLFTNNQNIQIEDISNQDWEKQQPQVKTEPNYHEYESLSTPMLETPKLYSLNSNSSEDAAW